MAMSVKVLFGNFSEDEVLNLYTNETKDLEFVWQEQLHVTAPTGQVIGKCPSVGNTLGIPSHSTDNSPGVLSPNIPPNPPSTPVEEINNISHEGGKGAAMKWNVNATPFIPANVSVINPGNDKKFLSSGGKKQLDYHYVSSKLDRLAHVTDLQEQRIVAKNHKHLNSQVHPPGGQSVDKIQTVGLSSKVSERTSHEQSDNIQTRTIGDNSSQMASQSSIVIPVSQGAPLSDSRTHSTEGAPSIQVQSHHSTSKNGCSNNASHSDSQSVVVLSTQSSTIPCMSTSIGVQSSSLHNQEHSRSIKTEISNHSKESGVLNTSSHSHTVTPPPTRTITPPPLHTTTNQSNTDLTSNRTISCSTPSGSLSPQSVASTGHAQTPITDTVPTVVTPAVPKAKSWASIVGRGSSNPASPAAGQVGSVVSNNPSAVAVPSSQSASCGGPSSTTCTTTRRSEKQSQEQKHQEINPDVYNTILRRLGEKLNQWKLSHVPVDIQPRGLTNRGNWCYMYAPLQALLCCPGMYHLCKSLDPNPPLTRDPSPTPMTDAMAQFFHEFKPYPRTGQPLPAQTRKKRPLHRPELLYGDPFTPVYVYDMLQKIKSNLSYKGRQEDAEEFLGCVLDRMHMEMVSAKKTLADDTNDIPPSAESPNDSVPEEVGGDDEEEEWEQVGPKNKSTITRQTSFSESPVTEIFGGELRSAVHRQGAKESATVEPFFSLQLDIQSDEIWTVKDALDALAVRETVHMSEQVEAQRRITLAHLPPVLILHLKRFIFNMTGGSQKLSKPIQYSSDLEISKDLLAPAVRNKLTLPQRSYKLWAVVYHHGKKATGGHYTCDTHHPVCGGWVRIDDNILKLVPEERVLNPPASFSNRVAYLLFYRRLDTIGVEARLE